MYLYRKRNWKKWQKKYITDVFRCKKERNENYSNILLDNLDLLKNKDEHLPSKLYKFYAPTSDNILDIRNRKLWFTHPSSFNDPFDCHTGYDRLEYEKLSLVNIMKRHVTVNEDDIREKFTPEEIERISNSSTTPENDSYYSKIEDYYDEKRKIMDLKSQEFGLRIWKLLREKKDQLNSKIEKLRSINIRVACFSQFCTDEEFYKKIQMWSHYADNHKGFCVEYDLSSLKKEVTINLPHYDYYNNKDAYLNERITAILKGGIFPVIYTSGRVNFPTTKLYKIKIEGSGELNHNSDIDEIIYKTFVVKSANWSYEKEWRIILDGNICDYYSNRIPFPHVKKIYLGCKMYTRIIDTMLEIGDQLGVEVIIMKMDSKKFILEELRSEYYKQDRERAETNPYS